VVSCDLFGRFPGMSVSLSHLSVRISDPEDASRLTIVNGAVSAMVGENRTIELL